jgi:hypothetical protein
MPGREDGRGPVYRTVDSPEVDALRAARDGARHEWMMSHLALEGRVARNAMREDEAAEAHAEHARALLEWRASEARFVMARLGAPTQPLPRRRRGQ